MGAVIDGKYALVRLLGEGGMGEIYEARHTKIGRRAAVKFLHGHFANHPEAAQRFENEARAAGEVEHENIAGVYDVGVLPDGTKYLVMEYLDGDDLHRVLKRERTLTLARAADLVTQACHGLDMVHRRGIVHRDLKPANLFVTRRADGTEQVKILDFGIAKLRRPEGDTSATGTGVALGTAHYMSPEQARGDRDIGTRSDVYALGVILYELLSGRRPHDGDSLLQVLHHIVTRPPTPLEEVCPDLPGPVYRIVRKAMAADAADRFGGANELAEALAPFAGGEYRPSQRTPLEATRIETMRAEHVGAEVRPQSGGAAQSVIGVSSNAAPAGRRGRSIALAASAVALVVVGGEALLWMHGRGEVAPAMPPPSAAVSPPIAPSSAPPLTAAASSSADPLPPPAAVSAMAVSGANGSSESDADAPAPGLRKSQAPGAGSPPGSHTGATPGAGWGPPRGTPKPPSAPARTASTAATRPDCTQTYTIDSDGNKHFRPECFPTR